MKRDIILSGVGGQGILSIATVIGRAALAEGLQIKQAEVHGMSQRGGDVQSNLRISSETIHSDLIPQGGADIIISLVNIPNYPDAGALTAELRGLPHAVAIDIDTLAREAASPRSANMVLLGAAAPFLGIEAGKFEAGIRDIFARKGEAVVEMNLKAFRAGYEAARKQAER